MYISSFQTELKTLYSKVFFIYTHLIWSHCITVPHQSLGTQSVFCLASCETFIGIFMHMFSPQRWNELLGRQGHICVLYILPQSPALLLQWMPKVGDQEMRKEMTNIHIELCRLLSGLNFISYQINFYLIYWCFSDSLSNINAYTNTHTTWMDVRIGEQWSKVRILSK